ncbi:MAG: hypothetical protein ABIE23_06210 [archaeon]
MRNKKTFRKPYLNPRIQRGPFEFYSIGSFIKKHCIPSVCNKKGQIIAYDLFFAVTVFILLSGAMLLVWYYNAEYAEKEETQNDLKERVTRITDVMVNTRGSPARWDENLSQDINTIGLVGERRVIEKEKLQAFESMDYSKAVSAMKISGYNFYFKLEQGNQIIAEKYNTVSSDYLTESDYVVGTRRVVEYERKRAILSLNLYK